MLSRGVARLNYPATHRNRDPILSALREQLPKQGHVLEIASGSGQHIAYFAASEPELRWQPSDQDDELFASIASWTEGLDNVGTPVCIDVTSSQWPVASTDLIYCANMIHIAPWEACLGLLDGAAKVLGADGTLCLYGPFSRNGNHSSQSNHRFDVSLRSRNPGWGVRDLDVVTKEANHRELDLIHVEPMPANNLFVVFGPTRGG